VSSGFENAHDLLFPLVAAAPVGSLDLMTNVAMAFPRSPLHRAHAAYDLQLLSEGRFRLSLGSQVKAHIEKRYGATWGRPVARMRESLLATKAILGSWQDGSRVDFRGEYTTHTLMTPAFNPGPNPFGIPKVLVGALGPRMNELAAEVADGILVMPFKSDAHMRERTISAIEHGLATGGRNRGDIEVVAEVIVAVGRTDAELEASRAAKFLIGFYRSTPAYRAADLSEGGATFRKRDESTFSAAGLTTSAWDVRKPAIAAVNGHAIGIRFTLTLQCDIRIFAADDGRQR